MMSPVSVLEELEARAHLTMAETSRARSIFRQPRSPRSIERAWRLVATVRTMLAFTESDVCERIADTETFPVVVQITQLSYEKVRAFVNQAITAGLGKQDWLRALAEALEALGDALEGLYLSRDPEFRAIVMDAIKELQASPSQTPTDWRDALAAMPD